MLSAGAWEVFVQGGTFTSGGRSVLSADGWSRGEAMRIWMASRTIGNLPTGELIPANGPIQRPTAMETDRATFMSFLPARALRIPRAFCARRSIRRRKGVYFTGTLSRASFIKFN